MPPGFAGEEPNPIFMRKNEQLVILHVHGGAFCPTPLCFIRSAGVQWPDSIHRIATAQSQRRLILRTRYPRAPSERSIRTL